MKITKLKGGSLSLTSLYEDGNKKFVRKTINTLENREYGYVRWYSQLKKLQRYSSLGVYPSVLNIGYEENLAYFDIEYMEGFIDIKTILNYDNLSENSIQKIHNAMINTFSKLHEIKIHPISNVSKLYYKEEIIQKINDSLSNEDFSHFFKNNKFKYNNIIVYGIENYLDNLQTFFKNLELETEEIIHGNPTLENMMYSFEEDRVVFIDPYEESIIDSKFLDYSQVMQCSRSYYGFYNDRPDSIKIDGTLVSNILDPPINFKVFNKIFESYIFSSKENKKIIDILEATQFIRMLPFKCLSNNIDQAKFFYVHACYLLDKLL